MTILATKCPHCMTDNIALKVVGSSTSTGMKIRSALLRCPKCKMPSAAQLLATREAVALGASLPDEDTGTFVSQLVFPDAGDLLSQGWELLHIWPETPPPRIPTHLPQGVERALRAAEKNFPDPDLAETAAGAYGRALELATKDKAPEFKGSNLAGRISHLASTGKITSDLADWANHIRLVRNDALHGYEPVNRDELVAVRGLTEMLLTYLYSLPGMLADLRAKGPKET